MNQPWKVIVVLLGIFVAGGVTGGFVTLRVVRERFSNRPMPEEWAPRHLKRLVDRLALTPEQQEQIRPIVRHNMEQLNRLRNQSLAETQMRIESMQRDIAQKLTPEQRVAFERMNRELREAREAREKNERAKRPRPDRRPDAPPQPQPPGN
jgi:Spy/CpxP family protein refolding chaperone